MDMCFHFLWANTQEWNPGSCVTLWWTLRRTAKLIFRTAAPFPHPLAMCENPNLSLSLPTLTILLGMNWRLIVTKIRIFSVTHDIEYLSMWLLAVYSSSLAKYPLMSFAHLRNLYLLTCSVDQSLVRNTIWKYFSSFCRLSFHPLDSLRSTIKKIT